MVKTLEPRHTVLFAEHKPWESPSRLRTSAGNVVISPHVVDALPKSLLNKVTILSIFTQSKITAKLLHRMPLLQLIATRTTGFDHIDLLACTARGITVCNVPRYGAQTVAEHTFALLLALSRRIVESVERTRKQNFAYEGLRGFDLESKTIGVIGTGNIGSHVIAYAKAFNMQVVAYNIRRKPALARKLGFSYVPLSQLVRTSDIISLHTPISADNRHLLNTAAFHKMKRGVIILNTARGGLIDSKALVRALKSKRVAAAGLDVYEHNPELKVLLKMPNVLITPHNAFNTTEALKRIVETTIVNIKTFIAGSPRNVVKTAV